MRLPDLLKQTGSIICQTDTAEFDFTSHPMFADAQVIAGVGRGELRSTPGQKRRSEASRAPSTMASSFRHDPFGYCAEPNEGAEAAVASAVTLGYPPDTENCDVIFTIDVDAHGSTALVDVGGFGNHRGNGTPNPIDFVPNHL